jgi:hypothetical protein
MLAKPVNHGRGTFIGKICIDFSGFPTRGRYYLFRKIKRPAHATQMLGNT